MLEKLDQLVARCQVLLPDVETANTYARIRVNVPFTTTMSRRREIHLLNDLWIAALCIQHKIPLLSNDHDFDSIAGLEVFRW